MRRVIVCLLLVLNVTILCGCLDYNDNSINTGSSNTIDQTIIKPGVYLLNGVNEENTPMILIDENNMLQLINFDYDEIVTHYKNSFPDIVFEDNVIERMKEPYSYTHTSRKGEMCVHLFEKCNFSIGISYNEEDGIITFIGKDYYLEDSVGD